MQPSYPIPAHEALKALCFPFLLQSSNWPATGALALQALSPKPRVPALSCSLSARRERSGSGRIARDSTDVSHCRPIGAAVAVSSGELATGPAEPGAAADGCAPPPAAGGAPLVPVPEGAAPELIPTAGAYSAREDFLQKMEDDGQISFKYVLNDGQPHNSIWYVPGAFRALGF